MSHVEAWDAHVTEREAWRAYLKAEREFLNSTNTNEAATLAFERWATKDREARLARRQHAVEA